MENKGISEEHLLTGDARRYAKTIAAWMIAVLIAGIYLSSLWLSFTDSDRRAFSLEVPAASADHLTISVSVVHVDVPRLEMTTRLSFHLAGSLAQDETTPARDLKLVLNTISGPQEFDFPKGQRINPIEAVFPLEGDVNLYPFDRYSGVVWLFATMPQKGKATPAPAPDAPTNAVSSELAATPDLPVSAKALEQNVHVDTRTKFSATIPGLSFGRSGLMKSAQAYKGLTGIRVELKRSNHVLFIAIVTMLMMVGLSGGMVVMVLNVVSGGREMEVFQVTMATSLIFGLPALRNIQPGVPPPGTFGDSLVFTWAEIVAAASAVTLIVHWLLQKTSPSKPPQR